MKKLISFFVSLLVLVMLFSLTISSYAQTNIEETGCITIEQIPDQSEIVFYAYQLMELSTFDNDTLTCEYTCPESLEDFFVSRYGIDKTAPEFHTNVSNGISNETDLSGLVTDVSAIATNHYSGAVSENNYQLTDLPYGYYALVYVSKDGSTYPLGCCSVLPFLPDAIVSLKGFVFPDETLDENTDSDTEQTDATKKPEESTPETTQNNLNPKPADENSESTQVPLVIILAVLVVIIAVLAVCFMMYVRKNKKAQSSTAE